MEGNTGKVQRRHKRHALTVFLILLSTTIGRTQTIISGAVSGVWNIEQSPFYVEDSIYISAGEELTINEGVEVLFDSDGHFLVEGTLSVNGSENLPVEFKIEQKDATNWKGLKIAGYTSALTSLENLRITDTRTGITILGSSPAILDCYIAATLIGITCESSSPLIKGDSIFVENSIPNVTVKGIDMETSLVRVEECYISTSNNVIGPMENAYGISNNESQLYLRGNRIYTKSKGMPIGVKIWSYESTKDSILFNEIVTESQGMFVSGGIVLDRCLGTFIMNNTIVSEGLGKDLVIGLQNESYGIQIVNNIIFSDGSATGIECTSSYPEFVIFNDFYGLSDLTVGYGNLEENNILLNPMFLYQEPDSAYFLNSHSPCIDAGIPAIMFYDPDETRSDIGAHYYHQEPPVVVEEAGVPDDFELALIYPNPTNGSVLISLDVKHAGIVKISGYDILGHNLATIYNGWAENSMSVNWNMEAMSSGLYYIQIETANGTIIKKVALIR